MCTVRFVSAHTYSPPVLPLNVRPADGQLQCQIISIHWDLSFSHLITMDSCKSAENPPTRRNTRYPRSLVPEVWLITGTRTRPYAHSEPLHTRAIYTLPVPSETPGSMASRSAHPTPRGPYSHRSVHWGRSVDPHATLKKIPGPCTPTAHTAGCTIASSTKNPPTTSPKGLSSRAGVTSQLTIVHKTSVHTWVSQTPSIEAQLHEGAR